MLNMGHLFDFMRAAHDVEKVLHTEHENISTVIEQIHRMVVEYERLPIADKDKSAMFRLVKALDALAGAQRAMYWAQLPLDCCVLWSKR